MLRPNQLFYYKEEELGKEVSRGQGRSKWAKGSLALARGNIKVNKQNFQLMKNLLALIFKLENVLAFILDHSFLVTKITSIPTSKIFVR